MDADRKYISPKICQYTFDPGRSQLNPKRRLSVYDQFFLIHIFLPYLLAIYFRSR